MHDKSFVIFAWSKDKNSLCDKNSNCSFQRKDLESCWNEAEESIFRNVNSLLEMSLLNAQIIDCKFSDEVSLCQLAWVLLKSPQYVTFCNCWGIPWLSPLECLRCASFYSYFCYVRKFREKQQLFRRSAWIQENVQSQHFDAWEISFFFRLLPMMNDGVFIPDVW